MCEIGTRTPPYNSLEGETLALERSEIFAMEAYVLWERRGFERAPGKR